MIKSTSQTINNSIKIPKLSKWWKYLEWIFAIILVIFTIVLISVGIWWTNTFLDYAKHPEHVLTSVVALSTILFGGFTIINFSFSYLKEKRVTKKTDIEVKNNLFILYKELKIECEKQKEDIDQLKFVFLHTFYGIYDKHKEVKGNTKIAWSSLQECVSFVQDCEKKFDEELEIYEKLKKKVIQILSKFKLVFFLKELESQYRKFRNNLQNDRAPYKSEVKEFLIITRLIFTEIFRNFKNLISLETLNSKFNQLNNNEIFSKKKQVLENTYYTSTKKDLKNQNEFINKVSIFLLCLQDNWWHLQKIKLTSRIDIFLTKMQTALINVFKIWKQNSVYTTLKFIDAEITKFNQFKSIYDEFENQNLHLKRKESITTELENNLLIAMIEWTSFYKWFLQQTQPKKFKKMQNNKNWIEFKNDVIEIFLTRNKIKQIREKTIVYSNKQNMKIQKLLNNYYEKSYSVFRRWFTIVLKNNKNNLVWENTIYYIAEIIDKSFFVENNKWKSHIFNIIVMIQKNINFMNFIKNSKINFESIKIELTQALDLFNQNLLETSLNKFQKLSSKIADLQFEKSIVN